jgi:AraC-like DNA-binding protein
MEEYLAVIGSFQGFLLFGLLVFDSRLSTASRVLGVLCLLMASVLLMPFLLLANTDPLLWIAGWVFYFPAAAGALAYLYCRTALLDEPLKARDIGLFIPWVSCYLLVADIHISDPREMAQWIAGGEATTWRLQGSEYLFFLQAFVFAGFTILMISRYRRHANETLANFNPAIFRWMLMLQVFTILIWVLNALPALSPAPRIFSQVANLLMVVLMYIIAITQWRNPQLLTIPSFALEQEPVTKVSSDATAADRGELEPAMRAQLYEAVKAKLESQKLYLDSQLTLSGLAEATGLSRHHLSEVLNKHAGKNFYEFINAYRIADVCERLRQNSTEKVLDIAFEAGFSSKSTFNTIFKQFTGQTPTQYRSALQTTKA